MVSRRGLLAGLFAGGSMFVAGGMAPAAAMHNFFEELFGIPHQRRIYRRRQEAEPVPSPKRRRRKAVQQDIDETPPAKPLRRANGAYAGATIVDYSSYEAVGTIIVKTAERALYRILGEGKAKRYGVAVGKEGFEWSGTAKVGMKRENPVWTPPPEMIEREPKYAKWAEGMPGGLPTNPLGPRALYLYNGGDTGFRIHGTIHPESIGHAASSGCIRMLNQEVIELFDLTPVGTKVIVI